jgi:hypothetical protein
MDKAISYDLYWTVYWGIKAKVVRFIILKEGSKRWMR